MGKIDDLQSMLHNVSKIKLAGGMVGKVCTVLIVIALAMALIAWSVKIVWISALALIFLFILAFIMLWRVISFADKNPQAAILEGAEFLLYQQLMLGTKSMPHLSSDVKDYIDAEPVVLSQQEQESIMKPDELPDNRARTSSSEKEDNNG